MARVHVRGGMNIDQVLANADWPKARRFDASEGAVEPKLRTKKGARHFRRLPVWRVMPKRLRKIARRSL